VSNSGALVMGLAALAMMGTSLAARAADDPKLRAELDEIARRRIYFGHQSVGLNLIEGMTQLARSAGAPLRVVAVDRVGALPPGTFAHGPVPENGNPGLKIQSFERALSGATDLDIAFVKFCYVDFRDSTDVRELFARYQATIAALKAKHPRTTFLHVTVPLTTIQGGAKALVKRALGRPPAGVLENVRREEYNALLRQAVQGKEPLFDLARIESTWPDGRRETFDWKGRSVPALVPSYTDDGGHLNRAGELRAARELVSVLASVPVAGASAAR
jgi:hypothetical protein